MNKKMFLLVVLAAILLLAIPAPFKPSIWSLIKGRQLFNQVSKSADPVYIHDFSKIKPKFTVYGNWVNSYHVYSQVSYYQLSPRSSFGVDSEGPDRLEVNFLKQIQAGKECAKAAEPVSYCFIRKTSHSNQREFATYRHGEYMLVTELTTIHYKGGIRPDTGYLDYKRINEQKVALAIKTISTASPVSINEAKANFFQAIY
jgi:hypothetical protein